MSKYYYDHSPLYMLAVARYHLTVRTTLQNDRRLPCTRRRRWAIPPNGRWQSQDCDNHRTTFVLNNVQINIGLIVHINTIVIASKRTLLAASMVMSNACKKADRIGLYTQTYILE